MPYKFEKLEVWKLALEYVHLIYTIAEKLPAFEEYNLKSQIVRAGGRAQRAKVIQNRRVFWESQFAHSSKQWRVNIS